MAFACIACRRSFKRPAEQPGNWYRRCPHCAEWAIDLGRHFKSLKISSKSQWKKVAFLVKHGFFFQHVYDPESRVQVPYPETLELARAFVEQYAEQAIQVPSPPVNSEPNR